MDFGLFAGGLVIPHYELQPFDDKKFKLQTPSLRSIIIEDDVWIGAGVTILDGCTIGKGSDIGAGAILSKNVEPYSIVAGALATTIGTRE